MASNDLKDHIAKAARGNLIDRYVAWRDPVQGLRRQQARVQMAMASSFTGASRTKSGLRNWFTSNKSANDDLLPELKTLRGRCRDLARNQPLAAGALETVTTAAVGRGLRLQCAINARALGMTEEQAEAWQERTEFEFSCWAESKDCDLERALNFYEQQPLAFHNALLNGDVLAVLPAVPVSTLDYKTRIQLVEADRLCNRDRAPDTASLTAGVHLDAYGAATAFDILQSHPSARIGQAAEEWDTVQRFGEKTGRVNVVHLFDKKRPGQVRGAPYLAPVIEPLKQLGRYTEAELVAAVVSGMFTVFIKTANGAGDMLGAKEIEESTAQNREYELGNGAVLEGLPGDEVQTINPGRPNDSFDPFVMAILRQVGVGLELPFEVLIKHFTSSYTAARAALLEAWKFYRKRRRWLATNFCQPIYETWLLEAVITGRIAAPGFLRDRRIRKAYCGAVWHGDGMGVLDPGREADAAAKRMEEGITTLPEEIAAYDGGDWETKHRVQAKVAKARKADGLVKDASGVPIGARPNDPDDPN